MDEKGFNIVLRPEWGAKRCKGFETPNYPLETIVVFYNTDTRRCYGKEDCSLVMRQIQQVHQKLGLSDLHYNFLIGADGNVYEGRGWHRLPSKCVRNHDDDEKNYAIAYIGDWTNERLKIEMTNAFLSWVHLGIKKNNIRGGYKLVEEWEPIPLMNRKNTTPRRKRIKLTYNIRSKNPFHDQDAYDPVIAKQFIPAAFWKT